ncbi:MAG: hypothetical protein HYY84_03495 [Deltaproteobacteria bacterium]|nr:hypothetical protein [Deltaproteobacteria bacterium]
MPESKPAAYRIPSLPGSPLWMVTKEPQLNEFVRYLDEKRLAIEHFPLGPHELVFSRARVDEVRVEFARMIRRGESKLHRLCSLLCDAFFPERYEIESVVIAEVPSRGERFVLSQPLTRDELSQFTDIDLGNRQIQKIRFVDAAGLEQPRLVANFVEYQPLEMGDHGIYKIGSRIKAEEEIWNKVVDSIFDIDRLVKRDKKLRKLGRYVKDIFGLKIVVGTARGVQRIHQLLHEMRWTRAQLMAHGIGGDAANESLLFVEVKDYLGTSEQKRSGWQAIKSVVRWWGDTFEIQVQPLQNYMKERERVTKESHAFFKTRREAIRDEVAASFPLFGFYRDVLTWLFRSPDEPPPRFPGVSVKLLP